MVEQIMELREDVIVVYGYPLIRVWQVRDEKCIKTLDTITTPELCKLNDEDFVTGVGSSLEGWTTGADGSESMSSEPFFKLRATTPTYCIRLIRDGSTLAVALHDGRIELWKISTSLVDLCCLYLASALSSHEIEEVLKDVMPDELYQLVSVIHSNQRASTVQDNSSSNDDSQTTDATPS